MKKVIITRKIELRYNSTNLEERDKFYKDIKAWAKICSKAANQIVSNLFFLMEQGDMTYIKEKARRQIEDQNFFKDMSKEEKTAYFKTEDKEIYKLIAANEKEMIEGTLQNAFYKILSKRYLTECPSSILTSLNQRVLNTFIENRPAYIRGEKSIPNYKNPIPIPIQGSNLLNIRRHLNSEKTTKDFAFTLFGRPLRTNFGIDKSNNAYKMNQAFSAWFLPKTIKELESELSAILKGLKTLNAVIELKSKKFKIEATSENQKIYYYTITTNDDNGNDISFKMKSYKTAKKDADGNDFKDENGKKIKEEHYKIVSNIKLADSSIKLEDDQFEDKNNNKKDITRIFLLAVLEMEKEKYILDDNEIAYAELSPDQPVTVRNGNKEIKIGSIDDFTYRRIGIEGSRRRTQKDLRGVKGGHGRQKKLKALKQYSKYERNVAQDKLHNYSRQLIKFCLDNQCKYLHLHVEKLNHLDLEEMQRKIRYWSPAMFTSFIKYKAAMVGIEIIEIAEVH